MYRQFEIMLFFFFQDSVCESKKKTKKQLDQTIYKMNTTHTQFLVIIGKVKKKGQVIGVNRKVHITEQQEPTCAECQDTHEEAFLYGSSFQQKPSNLPVWDFPPRLQLRSLISPKMQMSNHICHIFWWFIVGRVGGAKAGISPATSNSKAICFFVM